MESKPAWSDRRRRTLPALALGIPGPDTLRTLLGTVPLAGAVLVVAVLLLLSTSAELRWLWSLIAVAAAVWTAVAVWETRRTGG